MHRKVCPKCKRESYSAALQGPWRCPYCDEDLTDVPPVPLDAPLPNPDEETPVDTLAV